MAWAKYILDLISIVAWPVTTITLTFLLRKQISRAISSLRKLKYGDLELAFREESAELAEMVSEELADSATLIINEGLRRRLAELARISPEAAVAEAWNYLEASLLDVAKRTSVELDEVAIKKPLLLAQTMLARGVITGEQFSIFRGLRLLRNKTVHWERMELATDEAMVFIDMALRVASSLSGD